MGVFTFHWYGALIGIGILASATASEWLARRRGYPKNLVWDGLWWVLVPGIVGARLYHVADLWSEVYSLDPLGALRIWEGGLGIWGGVVGGVLGIWGYWKLQLHASRPASPARLAAKRAGSFTLHALLNIVFFGLPLGQVIGRVGNFLNQEVYGFPSSFPWAIRIDPEHRLPGFEQFETFHPLFAYEIVLGVLGFLGMLGVEMNYSKLKKIPFISLLSHFVYKSYTGFFLVWYGTGRFSLEFLRPDAFVWTVGSLNVSQLFSVGAVVSGVILFRIRPRDPIGLRPPG